MYSRLSTAVPFTNTASEVLSGSATDSAYFGNTVAITADGLYLIVGAFGDSSSQGRAYVYSRVSTATLFAATAMQTLQDPALTSSAGFGQSVAFSDDALTAPS